MTPVPFPTPPPFFVTGNEVPVFAYLWGITKAFVSWGPVSLMLLIFFAFLVLSYIANIVSSLFGQFFRGFGMGVGRGMGNDGYSSGKSAGKRLNDD